MSKKRITYLKYRIALSDSCTDMEKAVATSRVSKAIDSLVKLGVAESYKVHESEEVRPVSAGGEGWRSSDFMPPYRMVLSDAQVRSAFENEAPLIVQIPLKLSAEQRKWMSESDIHEAPDATYVADNHCALVRTAGGTTITVRAKVRIGSLIYGKEIWRPVVESFRSYVEYKAGFGNKPAAVLGDIGPNGKADMRFDDYIKSRHSPLWRPAACMPKWACRLQFDVLNVELVRMNDKWQWQITMKKVASE